MYYFKPYYQTLSSYAVQLLSWGMGDASKWTLDRAFPLLGIHLVRIILANTKETPNSSYYGPASTFCLHMDECKTLTMI